MHKHIILYVYVRICFGFRFVERESIEREKKRLRESGDGYRTVVLRAGDGESFWKGFIRSVMLVTWIC